MSASLSNSRSIAVAAPEGTGREAGPTVQHLAEEGIAQGVGTGQQGTVEAGRQVAGTGEAAHLCLWIIKMM